MAQLFTIEDVRIIWNANCGDMQKCNDMQMLNRDAKAKAMLARLATPTGIPNLLRLAEAIQRAARSPFCVGAVPTQMFPAGFVASIDWFLNPDTLTLIEEGKYDAPKEIRPPEPAHASDALSYWAQRPARWEPTQEEFMRCQVQGLLTAELERKRGRKISPTPDVHEWMTNGGVHPWATDEELRLATERVLQARGKGQLPKGVEDFNSDVTKAKTFKELLEQRKEKADAESKAKPGSAREESPTPPAQADYDEEPW